MLDNPVTEYSPKWFVKIAKLIDTGRHDESVLHGDGYFFVLQVPCDYFTRKEILVTESTTGYVSGSDHCGHD